MDLVPKFPPPLDLTAEQRLQPHPLVQDLYLKVIDLGRKHGLLDRDLTPADGGSLFNPDDLRLTAQFALRYRGLTDGLKKGTPALCWTVGKLLMAAGEYAQARHIFQGAAILAQDAASQAVTTWDASRAALENGDGELAARLVDEAVRLDPPTFAPWPVGKYLPVKALGGGLGVSYRCWHKEWKADIVVKTLAADDLDRPSEQVLDHMTALAGLEHPSLVTVFDAGWTRPDLKAGPFMVRNFFDAPTLEQHVRQSVLSPDDWLEVALQIAEGMQALHARGLVHRDLKPSSVYLRRDGSGWQVKVVNAGLGWRPALLRQTRFPASLRGRALQASRACAAPEVLGDAKGAEPGPRSDVYAFARTLTYALLGTPLPHPELWANVPRGILKLLHSCFMIQPNDRLPDFNAVLDRLNALKGKRGEDRLTSPEKVAPASSPEPQPPSPAPVEAGGWRWLPTPENEPDPHKEADKKLAATPLRWPIVAARVRGKKHKHEGTHCDDWFEVERAGPWSLLAVADGAGSRKFSRVGARAICEAAVKRLAEVLGPRDLRWRIGGSVDQWFDAKAGVLSADDLKFAQDAVIGTMEATAQVIRQTAAARSASGPHRKVLGRPFAEDDLAATLLLAVHTCHQIDGRDYNFVVSCHVGDGMIAAVLPDGKVQLLAKPDTGAHAGETDFVTSPRKLERKRLESKTFVTFKPMRALMLMTDGVADDYFPPIPGMQRLFADLVLNRVVRFPAWDAAPWPNDKASRMARAGCEQFVSVATGQGVVDETVRSAADLAAELGVGVEELARDLERLRPAAVPLEGSPEPDAAQSLQRWLDAYTVRGSFDDRTLVVLYNPGALG